MCLAAIAFRAVLAGSAGDVKNVDPPGRLDILPAGFGLFRTVVPSRRRPARVGPTTGKGATMEFLGIAQDESGFVPMKLKFNGEDDEFIDDLDEEEEDDDLDLDDEDDDEDEDDDDLDFDDDDVEEDADEE